MITHGRIRLLALVALGSSVVLSRPDAAASVALENCGPVHCYTYNWTTEKHGNWEDAEENGWTLLDGGVHALHEDVELNHYHAHLEHDLLENTETHSHNSEGCSSS